MADKVRYFIDMDGTVAKFFDDVDYKKKMFNKGYFENLKPYEKMVAFVRELVQRGKDVYILTKCLRTDYCVNEKITWLKKYIPEITTDKMIMMTDNKGKGKKIIELGLNSELNILIDDYDKNLTEWEKNVPNGVAVKVINGLNGTDGNGYIRKIRV